MFLAHNHTHSGLLFFSWMNLWHHFLQNCKARNAIKLCKKMPMRWPLYCTSRFPSHATDSGGDWPATLVLTVPMLYGEGLIQIPLQPSGRGRSVWFISYLFLYMQAEAQRYKDLTQGYKLVKGWAGIWVLVESVLIITLCYFCMRKIIFGLLEELRLGHITTAFHR